MIIVGSGISGLTTGSLLSQLGYRVVVLESSSTAGGQCSTFERAGFEFDSGLSAVTGMGRWQFGRRVMDRVTGGAVEWRAPMPDGQPFDCCKAGAQTLNDDATGGPTPAFRFTADKSANKRLLKERFPDAKDQACIDQFFRSVSVARFLLVPWFLIKLLPRRSLREFLSRRLGGILGRYLSRTTADHLRQYTSNTALIGVLTYNYASLGMPPGQSSWLCQCSSSPLSSRSPPSYPVGGPSFIPLAACELIRRNGGLVFSDCKVERLLFDDNTDRGFSLLERSNVCWGVVVSGHKLYAKHVVCANGFRQSMLKLVPPRHRARLGDFPNALEFFDGVAPSSWSSSTTIITANDDGSYDSVDEPAVPVPRPKQTPRDKSGVGPSTSFLRLHVGLTGSSASHGLPASDLWLFPSWDHDADDRRAAVNREAPAPAVRISSPSAKDPSWDQRWPKRSVVVVDSPCDFKWFAEWRHLPRKSRGAAYGKLKDWYTDRLLKVLYSEYPSLRDAVSTTSLSTPLSANTLRGVDRGEALGVQHTASRMTTHAPDLAPGCDIDGLYFAGQDIAPVGGIEGGLLAGLLCALTICRAAIVQYTWIWITSRWW